ncbi:alpha/beta-Hydrolases superfamily protein [Zea mays]|nr:alpha/beta-Hydrolases superfamily protein [Zea mays]
MLNVNVASVGSLMLPDSLITIMDTNDYSAVPQQLKEQLNERYPGARRAVLKTGGDFPFLSRPDEVNLYLQLHLRRVGVEPRSDLVQGFTRNGSAGSSKDQKDGGDSFDNSGGDNGHHGSGGSDHDRRHCASESHHSDEPIPTSTMLANTVLELVM